MTIAPPRPPVHDNSDEAPSTTADGRSVVGLLTFAVATLAVVLAMVGLMREPASNKAAPVAGATTIVAVSLTEWAITPSMIEVPASGGTLRITNNGSIAHNFKVPTLGIGTADLNPGESEDLVIPAGTPGQHIDVSCEIAGHASSGMKAMIMFTGAGGGTPLVDGGGAGEMTWQEMDRMMEEVALAYPAATEGKGNQPMEPRIDADGTKVFDITTSNVKWEVQPGKIVDAMAYNGQIPGPIIQVDVGDKVRINLTNELDESTDIHFHGIRVPNLMDGVDPYTQRAVEPGGTFVYEFTTVEPAVGIYHSHHNAQEQIPNGLFGAFLVGEMPIPDVLVDQGYTQIDETVTMVLNDAGAIGLSLNGKSFPATEPYTLRVGEVMMVHYQNEGLLSHPMHLHQPSGWVIAKDGVPLLDPVPSDTINVAPGERYTVLYKATEPGVWAWHCHILTHAEGPEGMFGMVTALIVTE